MSGRLRGVFQEKDQGLAVVDFHANWLCFSGDYRVQFRAKPARGKAAGGAAREYVGTHELPKIFGGLYRYEARIAGDEFTATYHSKYDAGTFAMTRQLTKPTRFH